MKILHLSDLHLNAGWLAWASSQAKSYDLVCVSGDLLDMFSRKGHFWGALVIKDWAETFLTRLALCSGNHDANSPDRIPDTGLLHLLEDARRREAERLMLLERWMDSLEEPSVVTDNRTQLVETASGHVLVTTIPYSFIDWQPRKDLWKAGQQLRKETRAPWIVLHHEPPAGMLVGGHFGSSGVRAMIERYQPDFVLSGHMHLQPYRGDFAERLGKTWCFNPGAPDEVAAATAQTPNHIVLDLSDSTAAWCFSKAGTSPMETRVIRLVSP